MTSGNRPAAASGIGPDERYRVEIQTMIVRIITSGASRERMTAMLRCVHRVEAWPVIRSELAELRAGGGGEEL